MSLVLRQNADGTAEYQVFHGVLEVGQIYKRKVSLRPTTEWLWALNGVPISPGAGAFAGLAESLEHALAALGESWSRWLASAQLLEADACSIGVSSFQQPLNLRDLAAR